VTKEESDAATQKTFLLKLVVGARHGGKRHVKMRRHLPHRMKGPRLVLLVFHGHVAQDFDQGIGFMMRFLKRAPVWERRERPGDFLSGHILEAGAARRRPKPNCVLKVSLTVPNLFV
jgi:hypothetical protein